MVATLPAILLYEIAVRWYYQDMVLEVRNSAEIFLKDFLRAIGLNEPLILLAAYLVATVFIIILARRQGYKFPGISAFFMIIFESVFYAVFLGSVTGYITNQILSLQTGNIVDKFEEMLPQILMAFSAGIWEEILFRLLMLGLLLYFFQQLMHSKRWLQIAIATFISSVIFSVFHYASFEYFTWSSFTFRFVAGCILGLLFVHRGLAVAVYTHSFYDFFFFLQNGTN
ncbi:MAG: CPBP family intramembrane metalloprotease [Deferribacteres bacterium]|nr:CPBP family intramembrane metalloprotease [candidate division KSB1 bacterium]MCB9503686.1 CPBP family intramembrane metalloprotease [Deferribacteres bacterium]